MYATAQKEGMQCMNLLNTFHKDGRESRIGKGTLFGIVRGPLYGHLGIKADVFMPQVHQVGVYLVRLFLLGLNRA